ncbi:SAV_6107 family HEPN domain-containing protein [Pseudactinotalea sp. Z1739]|uniref:SAV_6107 family HEPN domain-containing protein n=1 Tax=Pseudactinotalea sp. Z1739 TaxID=3413028 RepID=UPI003C7E9FAB
MGGAVPERLLRRAHAELDQLSARAEGQENFLHAHMAALRAGAALLALHPASAGRRRAVRSVWEQIAELDEVWVPWAALFASGAPIRAAIETGRAPALEAAQVARTEQAAVEFVAIVTEAVRTAREPTHLPAMAS